MDIFIKLCHSDPEYKSYIVMKEVSDGNWEQWSIALDSLEEAQSFIETRNDFKFDD